MEFRLKLRMPGGEERALAYDPITSAIAWEDGSALDLSHIGFPLAPQADWPVAPVVSPSTPLGKGAIKALKIQMGLKCNYKCGYCNQTARPASAHGTPEQARAFLDGLDGWFRPVDDSPRIEFWGGEPFAYWQVMQILGEDLHRRWPKAEFNVVTNGTILDAEKIDWLVRHKVAVAVSHDGPGQTLNRDADPFDTPKQAEALRALYRALRPHDLISFNCVLAKNNLSLAAVRDHIARGLGVPAADLPLTTEEIVLPYDEGEARRLSPQTAEEHTAALSALYADIVERGANTVFNVRDKVGDFFRSLAQRRPASALGQRCGMDRADTIAVDLAGNVVTCQNSAAEAGQRIGLVADYDGIRLDTAWHWSKREGCPSCLVLQLCKGACLKLEGALWKQTCDNSRTYNMALLATALKHATGGELAASA